MSGPNDPITVHGDVKTVLAYVEMCANAPADATSAESADQRPNASASRALKKRITSGDEVPIKLIHLGDDLSKTVKIGGESMVTGLGAAGLHPRGGGPPLGGRFHLGSDALRIAGEPGGHPQLQQGMCIDYTDLNKACPKDLFPLPHIDQIVDSTTGCDLL
uniref:Uncharacterized protein n=1 Tax=Oryza brachyantha TaxID=4533 RepID=J3M590_ORYBR